MAPRFVAPYRKSGKNDGNDAEAILAYGRRIEALARESEAAQRLMAIPGVGPVTATAIVATVGQASEFKNGRHFATWLGLVPRQYSTGGKVRLGRITKRGDVYLRTLLIHGTRAVLATLNGKTDRASAWGRSLIERRGYKRAAVALAAKNARTIWAMLAKGGARPIAPRPLFERRLQERKVPATVVRGVDDAMKVQTDAGDPV